MIIDRVVTVFYSATGNTKKAAIEVGDAMAVRFGCSHEIFDFTLPEGRSRTLTFSDSDAVVMGIPTYRGKLPVTIVDAFRENLKGNGTPAVAVTTFGNRAFENSLADMNSILSKNGFVPVSGCAIASRHAYSDLLAPGKPDADDLMQCREFGYRSASMISKGVDGLRLDVPGIVDAPFYIPKGVDGKPVSYGDVKPETILERCTGCGLCVKLCPLGIIKDDNVTVDGTCFKCHACIRGCPEHAKVFIEERFLTHIRELEKNQLAIKDNAFFYAGR